MAWIDEIIIEIGLKVAGGAMDKKDLKFYRKESKKIKLADFASLLFCPFLYP